MINIELLKLMAHSRLDNYVVPGLTSYLIGNGASIRGNVRMFECSRTHHEPIIPHSHRFDFQCLVLKGEVANVKWIESDTEEDADAFIVSHLTYTGEHGQYEKKVKPKPRWFRREITNYKAGDWYSMTADEIHSIYFNRDTQVLFFEGPQIRCGSIILEPYVNGEHIPTFKVEPWMFKKE